MQVETCINYHYNGQHILRQYIFTMMHSQLAARFILHWKKQVILYACCTFATGWPLSRQCEIPWWFVSLFRRTLHVKCYSYHACNSTKYLYGCKYAAYNKQFLGQFSPTGFFPTFPWLLAKNPWHFPDSCQISRHFQVFQTSGHPVASKLRAW